LFGKREAAPKNDINISAGGHGETPYMAARREWNERYGDYIAAARNWRFAAIVLAMTSLVLAIGTIYISAQPQRVPYIVEVDKIGQVVNVAAAELSHTPAAALARAGRTRFTVAWRSVTPDTVVQKAALDRLYKMVPQGSASLEKINGYYQDNSPFIVAQTATVSIEPIGLPLPLSDQSWQVEWYETRRKLDGVQLSRVRYKGVLIVALNPPKNANQTFDLDNPIGLYVTDLNWSQQL